MSQDSRLEGVIVCGAVPTEADLRQIERYRQYLKITREGKQFGLSRAKARELAAMEVYGDVNCEGDGLPTAPRASGPEDGKPHD